MNNFSQVTDMKNIQFRGILSALCMAAILAGFTKVSAGPVRFNQVVQIVSAQPGKAQTGAFSRLRLSDDYTFLIRADDGDDKKNKGSQPQDGRVITETKIDIVKDDVCDCEEASVIKRGFPKWALLGLAAIPIAFILIKRKNTPTPTGTVPNMTPTPSTTPTPSPSVTPTPSITPTPPPEPVPEPMTILLFGTGLASIGLAARRKFGKKSEKSSEKSK